MRSYGICLSHTYMSSIIVLLYSSIFLGLKLLALWVFLLILIYLFYFLMSFFLYILNSAYFLIEYFQNIYFCLNIFSAMSDIFISISWILYFWNIIFMFWLFHGLCVFNLILWTIILHVNNFFQFIWCNWNITSRTFKVYNVIIWHTQIAKGLCNKVS